MNMIEKVAKEIYPILQDILNGRLEGNYIPELQLAIAAIKALCEPTKEMIEAGSWCEPGGEIIGPVGAQQVWEAMIEVALNDKN